MQYDLITEWDDSTGNFSSPQDRQQFREYPINARNGLSIPKPIDPIIPWHPGVVQHPDGSDNLQGVEYKHLDYSEKDLHDRHPGLFESTAPWLSWGYKAVPTLTNSRYNGYCNKLSLPSHSSNLFGVPHDGRADDYIEEYIKREHDFSQRQAPGYLALPRETPWTPHEWRLFHEHPDRAIDVGKIWPASLDPDHLGPGGQRIVDHEACLTRHPPEFPIDSDNFYKDYEERGNAVVGAIAIDSGATLNVLTSKDRPFLQNTSASMAAIRGFAGNARTHADIH